MWLCFHPAMAEESNSLTRHVQQAEASMSLGNVSTASVARKCFKSASLALRGAAATGHALPRHMQE